MNPIKRSTNYNMAAPLPLILYRGLFIKIAKKLGVDPSYVSRVARGERRSSEVVDALGLELAKIAKKLKASVGDEGARPHRNTPRRRLASFVAQEQNSLRREWLEYVQRDSNLKRIQLSRSQRVAPVLTLLERNFAKHAVFHKRNFCPALNCSQAAWENATWTGL